jgi:anti-anti-sigma factor
MFGCTITKDNGIAWCNAFGRIDSMTSPEIQDELNKLILEGQRLLVINLEAVTYISSAGLRVFLAVQKQLKKAGGEIVFFGVAEQVREVFTLSAFDKVFRIAATKEEILPSTHADNAAAALRFQELDGIVVRYLERNVAPGALERVGAQERLARAEYREEDVVSVRSDEFQFGTGLGTLGERYEEYRDLFGEAMVINRNLFYYPAVARPAVDFLLHSGAGSTMGFKFLHGFKFSGAYRYVVSFEGAEGLVELSRLVAALFRISQTDLLGVVLLAESKGLWGMHLKKVPIQANQPQGGASIFAAEHFSEWMNFPVEPTSVNHVVAAAGIAIRDKAAVSAELNGLTGKDSTFHLHGAVFAKEPLSKRTEQFEAELNRVLTELEVYKVQHLLGQTRLSSGTVGIIELKG